MARSRFLLTAVGLLFLLWRVIVAVSPPSSYRFALIQFDTLPGQNEHNLQQMERLAREAADQQVDFIMFHELSVMDYVDDVSRHAEFVPGGPSCKRMEALARERNVYISFGLAEKTVDGRHFITYVFTGPQGFVYKYRKTWIWREPDDKGYRNEWARFDTGTGPEIFEIAGLKATCFICADGESPRCIKRAKDLKPEIVFYPNNRGAYLGDRAEFSQRAATIGAPMLVTNRIGQSWHANAKGGCSVISATGEVLAKTDPVGKEEILIYDLIVGKHIKRTSHGN